MPQTLARPRLLPTLLLLGPNVAGFFNPVIPVFGTLAAVIFLGEQLHAYDLAGFALVLGVALTSKR